MDQLSYRRYRFPPPIIQHAIWLYLRFTLSYRDVEKLLAERGLEVSYETVRRWVLKFGPGIARKCDGAAHARATGWRLDKMVVRIAGKRTYIYAPISSRWLAQSGGRSSRFVSRAVLRSAGWRPSKIVSTMSGARNASGSNRLT